MCEHCGTPEQPGNPVQECWYGDEQAWLHRGCQPEWVGDDLSIPGFLRRAS